MAQLREISIEYFPFFQLHLIPVSSKEKNQNSQKESNSTRKIQKNMD